MGKTTSKFGIAGLVISEIQGVIDLVKANLPDFKLDQAQIEIDATEEEFILRFSGTDFDYTTQGEFIGQGITQLTETDARGNTTTTNLWKWQLYVNAAAGFVNDEITFRGWVQHVYQPHNEDKEKGKKLDFFLIASADQATEAPNGSYELKMSSNNVGDTAKHSAHKDHLIKAELTATVTSTFDVDDITGYTFLLEVNHNSDQNRESQRQEH